MEDRRKENATFGAQKLCEQGGGPGQCFLCLILPLSLINRRVSVDVKLHGR